MGKVWREMRSSSCTIVQLRWDPMISGRGVPGRRFALLGRKRLARSEGVSTLRGGLRAHLAGNGVRTEGNLSSRRPSVLALLG